MLSIDLKIIVFGTERDIGRILGLNCTFVMMELISQDGTNYIPLPPAANRTPQRISLLHFFYFAHLCKIINCGLFFVVVNILYLICFIFVLAFCAGLVHACHESSSLCHLHRSHHRCG